MEILNVVIEITLLVGMSGLCSGLNVAILAIDLSDIRRKAELGDIYARRVLPLRQNYHLTLASILLVNVAFVSATSLTLEHHMNGLIAGLVSTLLIVVFGEIMPQALFARDALRFCGRLAPLLWFMTWLTYPLSKPLQLLLDRLFSKATGSLQSRHELGILISEHLRDERSELDKDEVEIMRSTLQLSEKRVQSIMTPIRQTFWLHNDAIIDARLIDTIKDKGFSRIPIFDTKLHRCYGVLLMKELVDINFDEHTYAISELPLHESEPVGSMTALDTMFRKFISAHTHLLPIEKSGRIIGIVTIEDLLEEILGHEIRDETDHATKRR